MEDNENEAKLRRYRRIKLVLKILGPIIAITGFGLFMYATIPFVMDFNTDNFYLSFIGMPIIFIGGVVSFFGFAPIGIRASRVNNVSHNEMRSERMNFQSPKEIACPSCGKMNSKDSKYCNNCGKKLVITCKWCGAENELNSKFCSRCGRSLD